MEKDELQLMAGLRLATALEIFWGLRGSPAEGVEWLCRLLARPTANTPVSALIRGRALNTLCTLEVTVESMPAAAQVHAEDAYALGPLVGVGRVVAAALRNLGVCALRQGRLTTAQAYLEHSLSIWRQMKRTRQVQPGMVWVGRLPGCHRLPSRSLPGGRSLLSRKYVEISALRDANFLALGLRWLGNAKLRRGEVEQARIVFQESLQLNLTVNSRRGIVATFASVAAMLAARGDGQAAARLFGATKTLLAGAPTTLTLTNGVDGNTPSKRSRICWMMSISVRSAGGSGTDVAADCGHGAHGLWGGGGG